MNTIGVVAMGEMGSAIAGRLVAGGARVVTSLAGRSGASTDRALRAGVELVTDTELIGAAEMLLCIVPPSLAAQTAERFFPIIRAAVNKPLFIDCNAIAPQTLHAIAQPFLQKGLPFGDAAIMGTPPKPGGPDLRFYMSGPIGEAPATTLKMLGLRAQLISPDLGDASALKMAYAGITKGFQAIATSMALGAARAGVGAAFVSELRESQPDLYAWLVRMLPAMYAKAHRWDGELLEIAKFLEPEAGASGMFASAAMLYRRVAEEHRIGPDSEVISILEEFLQPSS